MSKEKSNVKWVNTRIGDVLKERYDNALEKAKADIGRHVFSPEIIVPAITAFCEAVESGNARDFLNGQYTKK